MTMRVKEQRESGWEKLHQYMGFMEHTQKDVLILSMDNLHVIKWYVDASFVVHPYFRSYSGVVIMMEWGAMASLCSK